MSDVHFDECIKQCYFVKIKFLHFERIQSPSGQRLRNVCMPYKLVLLEVFLSFTTSTPQAIRVSRLTSVFCSCLGLFKSVHNSWSKSWDAHYREQTSSVYLQPEAISFINPWMALYQRGYFNIVSYRWLWILVHFIVAFCIMASTTLVSPKKVSFLPTLRLHHAKTQFAKQERYLQIAVFLQTSAFWHFTLCTNRLLWSTTQRNRMQMM